MSEVQPQRTRNCVSCGRPISWDANVCPYCGHDFRGVMAGSQQTGKKRFQGSLAILIILIILCWPAGLIYFLIKADYI